MILSKDSILSAPDLKRETVDVPEWGDGAQVIVGEMSALERMKFAESMEAPENQNRHYISLALVHFLINEDGSKMFGVEDVDTLAGKSQEVLMRLYEVGKRLNVLGVAVADETKN